jgi:2-polyprenyl-3-methyl-5-hydroxy-6-metoxy-1,4-benzoquinol methylase
MVVEDAGQAEDTLADVRDEVEKASRNYYHTPQQAGIDNRIKRLIIERCEPYIQGPRVLELGYIDGIWTDVLLQRHGCSVDIVEGASRHVEHAEKRYADNPTVRVFHQLFQEFEPGEQYDTVLAADMLSCLPDAAGFLRAAAGWLKPEGHLIATVPNSRSLHRRIGALMNIEATPTEINELYRQVGNRGSYDRYALRHLLLESGLEIKSLRGCFLKPLTSAQIETWSDELLRAFAEIGDELEDYCYYMYAVCRKQG